MQMPQVRDAATGQLAPRPLWNPDVPIGEAAIRRSSVSAADPDRQRQVRQRHVELGIPRQCRLRPLRRRQRSAAVSLARTGGRPHRPVLPRPRSRDCAPEGEGVPILEGPYPFAGTRAVMIEDLDGLALSWSKSTKQAGEHYSRCLPARLPALGYVPRKWRETLRVRNLKSNPKS